MLNFMRNRARQIVAVTVVLFLMSLFGIGSYSFFSRNRKTDQNKIVQANVAIINGAPIDESRYYRYFNQFLGSIPPENRLLLDPDVIDYYKHDAFQKTITYMLALEEAKKEGIKALGQEVSIRINQIISMYKLKDKGDLKRVLKQNNIEWRDFKKQQKEEVVFAKFINGITSRVRVTPLDKKMAFTEIKARQILIKIPETATENMDANLAALKKAESIYERILEDRRNFGRIARRFSDDLYSKENNGELGWIGRGQMPAEFENLIYNLKVGDLGGPIRTIYGYHIVEVMDRRDKPVPENMTDQQIESQILQEKQNEAVQKWLKPLKDEADIEIKDPALKAYTFRADKKYEEALIEYKKQLANDGGRNYLVYIQIARMLEKMGRSKEAEEQYKVALVKQKLTPQYQYPALYFSVIDFYVKHKNKKQAKQYLSSIRQLFKDKAVILEYMLSQYGKLLSSKEKKVIEEQVLFLKAPKEEEQGLELSPMVPLATGNVQ